MQREHTCPFQHAFFLGGHSPENIRKSNGSTDPASSLIGNVKIAFTHHV